MADAPEQLGGPPAVDQTGNLTIWAIPGGTAGVNVDALTAANLGAVTAKRITYSFLPDGYSLTMPQEKNDDDRLTSPQRRQSLGKVNPDFSDFKYVDSTDSTSAAEILKAGGSWIIVERRKVPQTTVAAATQIVRGILISLGAQAPGPTNGTGKFSKTQAVVVEHVGAEHALT